MFATDRHTAEAVNDPEYLPPSAEEKSGLINKWPFDAKKEDYTYWDGLLGEAVDATYDGTETIDGLETYKYHVLDRGRAGRGRRPTSTASTPRTSTSGSTRRPGAIVNQTQHEVRELEDGSTLLDMHLAFTDDQVAANAATPRTTGACWTSHQRPLPLIGFIGGAIALLAGLFLLLCVAAPRRDA